MRPSCRVWWLAGVVVAILCFVPGLPDAQQMGRGPLAPAPAPAGPTSVQGAPEPAPAGQGIRPVPPVYPVYPVYPGGAPAYPGASPLYPGLQPMRPLPTEPSQAPGSDPSAAGAIAPAPRLPSLAGEAGVPPGPLPGSLTQEKPTETATPEAVPGVEREPLPPEKPLSSIEQSVAEAVAQTAPRPLRQFGYEMFQPPRRRLPEAELDPKLMELKLLQAGLRVPSISVTVLGEAVQPGIYALEPPVTVLSALLAAGGPTRQGTMRRLELRRQGALAKKIDLYKLLLEGEQREDAPLQEGDLLFIPPIGRVVAIAGHVNRPAIYEIAGTIHLLSLLDMAGGVTPFGYLQHIQVERAQAHAKKIVVDLNLAEFFQTGHPSQDLEILGGDIVRVFPISARVDNLVELKGNVERPGRYELKPGMRISDLLKVGGGLLPESYLPRAELQRFSSPDQHLEILPLDLEAVLANNSAADLPLQKQDILTVFSVFDFKKKPEVKVEGAVRRPGEYPLLENLTIKDLLYKAGGLQDEAFKERALLTRMNSRRISPEGTISPHFQWINLEKVLAGDPAENLKLEDMDVLTVHSVFYYGRKPLVSVEGMVRKPGEYELLEGMKLSDLLNQAGGLQKEAFRERALLSRVNSRTLSPQATVVPKFYWVYLDKLLQGDDREDVPLQELDKLTVYSVFYYGQRPRVKIKGMVRNPREYELFEQMRASDLVNLAGGVTDQAFLSKVLLTRVSTSRGSAASGAGQAEFIWINLGRVLKGDHAHDVRLQHLDELTVYPTWFFSQLLGPQGVREVRAADEGKDTTTAQRARAPSGPEKKAKASERTGRGAGRP